MHTRVLGVFCDLDGTLVDTTRANFLAYRDALGLLGVPFGWDDFVGTWGADSRDFLPRVAPSLRPADIARVRRVKAELYPDRLGESVLNRGLLRLLTSWGREAQVVLVTTAKRANVAAVLDHHGLHGVFSTVISGDDTARSKPAPDPYLLALERTGLRAQECIALEDSEVGAASARAAGLDVLRIGGVDAPAGDRPLPERLHAR